MTVQPSPSTSRRLLGRYELLFRIARGGMAEVHAARMVGVGGFEKLVAVKLMLSHLAEDEHFVDMFLDEGRLAVHIGSPHVVQTLDLGQAEDGTLYLVMELVRGVSLARALRNVVRAGERMPLGAIAELLAQAAQGLDDAHNATTPLGEPLKLIHRDVSPQNLLLGIDGRMRVVDFGIARAVQRSTHTRTGQMKGKFAYFAPEQARADGIVDHRVDVFALGIVAWECLTGLRLFKADNPAAQLDKVRSMPIPSVREMRPEVPQELAGVVARALRRDPDARWPTAGQFAAALRESARQGGLSLPDRSTLGELVRQWGGEQLAKLEENLRRALTEPHPHFVTLPGEKAAEPNTGSGIGAVRSDSLPGISVPPDAPSSDGSASASLELPVAPPGGSLPVPPVASPRRTSAAPWIVGGTLAGLLLAGLATWWLWPATTPPATPSPPPATAATPPATQEPAPESGSEDTARPEALAPRDGEDERREAAADPPSDPTPPPPSPPASQAAGDRRTRRAGRAEDRREPSLRDIARRAEAQARTATAESERQSEAQASSAANTEAQNGSAANRTGEDRSRGTRPASSSARTPSKSTQRSNRGNRPQRTRRGGPNLAGVDDFERELGL